MIRKIVQIDQEKCNGCGACALACHEGAIEMINGKAVLIKDDYCDGLGDCLPACPTKAITMEEREAAAYDEKAVQARQNNRQHKADGGRSAQTEASAAGPAGAKSAEEPLLCGCPGSMARSLERKAAMQDDSQADTGSIPGQLSQWPVQIKLVPLQAPYFQGADLLVAADCTAFAYGDFHRRFIRGRITLIGCPKLDEGDYSEKLTEILKRNDIRSVTVVRMEVPCCCGIENAVKRALQASGKFLPWHVVTVSAEGKILSE